MPIKRSGAAVRDHQFERLGVRVDLDAVVLRDLFGDRLSQIRVAFAAAVMVLAGGDDFGRFFRQAAGRSAVPTGPEQDCRSAAQAA